MTGRGAVIGGVIISTVIVRRCAGEVLGDVGKLDRWWAAGNGEDHVGMSERSLRQSYEAIIRAVAAADKDALDRPDRRRHR